MDIFVYLISLVGVLLGVTWWQARPSAEHRFIQSAEVRKLAKFLSRGRVPAK